MNESNNEKMLGQVTTEMLYDFLRDFKSDVNRGFGELRDLIKEETRQREKLEARMENRFDKMEQRFEKVEVKLEEVYVSRESMTVRFTTKWAFMSFFIAMLSSIMALVVGRAF